VDPALLLENVNAQKNTNVSDRLLNQSNADQNVRTKSQTLGENGQNGHSVQKHVLQMEKEVRKQENEHVMEHVMMENHKMSGLVTKKSLVRNPTHMGNMESGPIGVIGVRALVRVKKLLKIDGEIVNLVGTSAMDKIKKLFHAKCIIVLGITQMTQIIIGKFSLDHGQIGQTGQVVLKRVELDSFIDQELAIENKRDVRISLAEK